MASAPKLDRAPIRRVVTGHAQDGKSTIVEDAPIGRRTFFGSGTLFTDLYWTDSTPASNELVFNDSVKDHTKDLFPPNGTSLRVVEMPPGQTAPLHRTVSIDYGIITHGQLTLILENDKRVVLYPGDVVIQRGTMHGWVNEGNEWTRMYCVMLPSEKVKIVKELEAEFPRPPPQKNASQRE